MRPRTATTSHSSWDPYTVMTYEWDWIPTPELSRSEVQTTKPRRCLPFIVRGINLKNMPGFVCNVSSIIWSSRKKICSGRDETLFRWSRCWSVTRVINVVEHGERFWSTRQTPIVPSLDLLRSFGRSSRAPSRLPLSARDNACPKCQA